MDISEMQQIVISTNILTLKELPVVDLVVFCLIH